MMYLYERASSRWRRAAALAAGLVLAACGDSLDVPEVPVGSLTVAARSVNNAYVARPEAIFVLTGDVPTADSRAVGDTCRIGEIVPLPISPSLVQLDAGDAVTFETAGTSFQLRPTSQFGVVVYNNGEFPDVAFTPGATVTFTIPGRAGGFPAASLTSPTPPALVSLSPIPANPSLQQPLTVTWSPVGDASSRFELALQYAVDGATTLNRQLLCDWQDDGTAVIRAELLGGWASSELRRIEVTRYRTKRETIGESVLFFLATYDSVVTPAQ